MNFFVVFTVFSLYLFILCPKTFKWKDDDKGNTEVKKNVLSSPAVFLYFPWNKLNTTLQGNTTFCTFNEYQTNTTTLESHRSHLFYMCLTYSFFFQFLSLIISLTPLLELNRLEWSHREIFMESFSHEHIFYHLGFSSKENPFIFVYFKFSLRLTN